MKKFILALLLFFNISTVVAQDGKIIEQVKYSFPDTLENEKNTFPVSYYHITYLSDGLSIKGFIAIPEDGQTHPCILFNRGGNESYNMLTNETFAKKADFLLRKGYVVAATQYRGSAGSDGKDELGGGDVNDVLNLITALKYFPSADTTRIGLFGWSRGAINTYIALTKKSTIKAAVIGGGFADLVSLKAWRKAFDTTLYSRLIPGYASTKNEDFLKVRSAFYFADKIPKTIPILILHGTADANVPATQALNLAHKFYEVKQPYRLIVYEGGVHSLEQYKSEYQSEILNWFNKYVRDEKKPPDLETLFKR